MPEYLAPAVYVEEVDTGTKPIEGVSTSTSGMVGVTERGPVNVPILVTSLGEYQRWFGQNLDAALFGEHRFLPHAVEGFFTNGGKRLFVTRVLEINQALPALRMLVAPDLAAPPTASLLLPAAPGAGALVIEANPGLVAGDTVQIGDGVSAEFQTLAPAPANAATVALRRPLSFDHANPMLVEQVTLADAAPPASNGSTLASAAVAGANLLNLLPAAFAPALAAGDLLRVGNSGADDEELVFVDSLPGANTVRLRAPLQWPHAAATTVVRQQAPTVGASAPLDPATPATPGQAVVMLNAAGVLAAGDWARFQHTDATRVELRRVGTPARATFTQGAYGEYPAGTRVERVGAVAGLVPTATIDLSADSAIGATVITVSNRTALNRGDLLAVGLLADREYVEIVDLPAPAAPPNAGTVVLRAPLRRAHVAAANIVNGYAPLTAGTLNTTVARDAGAGATDVTLTDTGLAANDLVRVTPPAGGPYFHALTAVPTVLTPQTLPLVNPLDNAHAAAALVARRVPMIEVRALDAGRWGNRLRAAMEMQDPPLLVTQVRQVVAGRLRLDSASGVEVGTELLVTDVSNTTTALKVAAIDRGNDFEITLEPTTPLPGLVAQGNPVRSREYRFVVELLRQPDPSNPARNNSPIDREVFAGLSLDPRHSRYFQRVIGCTWPLANPAATLDDMGRPLRRVDRRSEGESGYVRVFDLAPGTGLRTAPVATYETPPGGVRRLVLLPLGNGVDGAFTDNTYIGQNHTDPERRTGLFTLRNVEEISIVAAPGRTSATMQNALINHCELMRYRFAVLDGMPPPSDSMADIQAQRAQYDTKYAALYHPWLLIPDPYPSNPAMPADYPIPPAGHMVGIYARTDIERGVHKAPANEVVRGVIGLQRVLNKEQHDLLNPYPVNVNVIRDFRTNNRGIRVYGGRCITSDSDWKYVNVRRLLIFIEASVDRGLQWVVFEPNAEPLWARVRRAITNFLTLVWRNGALEGTKPEEAFFVKCDRTTMTQTDIDQGRLICLVGVAPVKPAEFVIVRIGLWTAHADD